MIKNLFLLAVIAGICYGGWKFYEYKQQDQHSSRQAQSNPWGKPGQKVKAVAGKQQQLKNNPWGSRKSAASGTRHPDNTVAPKHDNGPLSSKSMTLPAELDEADDSMHYRISNTSTRISNMPPGGLKNAPPNKEFVCGLFMQIGVFVPGDSKAPVRLKIFKGSELDGKYQLIYDRVSKAPAITARPRYSYTPLNPKMPEDIRKKILERRKKMAMRRMGKMVSFHCREELTMKRDSSFPYYRMFICREDGTLIKAAKLFQPMSMFRSRTTAAYKPFRQSTPEPDAVYPSYFSNQRILKFLFKKKNGFMIRKLSINGIDFEPVFLRRDRDYQIRKQKCYESLLNLNYPFGGKVDITFLYRKDSGKIAEQSLSFCLPPPSPFFKLKPGPDGKGVEISWDSLSADITRADYRDIPKLMIYRGGREIARLNPLKRNRFLDKNVLAGEPVYYTVSLQNGNCKAQRWSSKKGRESYQQTFMTAQSPIQYIVAPGGKNAKPRPVRIELMKPRLFYENTGISACRLTEKLVNCIAGEPELVLYDCNARDYIIDEKYFALSDDLKKQFLLKEPDYAVMIRDYSRRDGNGLELWLFQKCIAGKANRRTTVIRKIADVPTGNPDDMEKAIAKLIAEIRETLRFESCPDKRDRKIKPQNIICPEFLRPVNEKFVVWNYESISESIFVSLSDLADNVKILSKADWGQLFRERIARFDLGHSIIEQMPREILLTGRMWGQAGNRSCCIQACDAFTGEVAACRIFSGSLRDITRNISSWIGGLRLSKGINSDFHLSEFCSKEKMVPWRVRSGILKDFGPYLEKPEVSKQRSSKPAIPSTLKKMEKSKPDDFYTFVERQWRDGFRAKAVQMLEEKWKTSRTARTGFLLSSYQAEMGNYRRALELYDAMLVMDDCPVSVYNTYNKFKKLASGTKPAVATAAKPVTPAQGKTITANTMYGRVTGTFNDFRKNMDYAANFSAMKNGGKQTWNKMRIKVKDEDNIDKYYFIDRDKIYAEWAPGQPCRTSRLVMSLPGDRLSKGLLNPVSRKYGVWTEGHLRGFPNCFDREGFFNYMNLYRNYYIEPGGLRVLRDLTPAEEHQIKSVCKPEVIVIEAGWNSVDPFAGDIDPQLFYTRLGYFFRLYSLEVRKLNTLYDFSKVRAICELKKNPNLKFPRFTFYNFDTKRGDVADITRAGDMIRYFAYEALRYHKWNMKSAKNHSGKRSGADGVDIRDFKLYQLLALEYTAKHGNHMVRELFNRIISTPIPASTVEYRKARMGMSFLVFMAYRGNKSAQKLLSKLLDGGDSYLREASDCAYLMGQAGLAKLAAQFIALSDNSAKAMVLRWIPDKVLDEILVNYGGMMPNDVFCYYVFGTRNDRAARKWLMMKNFNVGSEATEYFGKPLVEVYQDWREDHFRQVKSLKNKKAEK